MSSRSSASFAFHPYPSVSIHNINLDPTATNNIIVGNDRIFNTGVGYTALLSIENSDEIRKEKDMKLVELLNNKIQSEVNHIFLGYGIKYELKEHKLRNYLMAIFKNIRAYGNINDEEIMNNQLPTHVRELILIMSPNTKFFYYEEPFSEKENICTYEELKSNIEIEDEIFGIYNLFEHEVQFCGIKIAYMDLKVSESIDFFKYTFAEHSSALSSRIKNDVNPLYAMIRLMRLYKPKKNK
jgi:hypothetical protein